MFATKDGAGKLDSLSTWFSIIPTSTSSTDHPGLFQLVPLLLIVSALNQSLSLILLLSICFLAWDINKVVSVVIWITLGDISIDWGEFAQFFEYKELTKLISLLVSLMRTAILTKLRLVVAALKRTTIFVRCLAAFPRTVNTKASIKWDLLTRWTTKLTSCLRYSTTVLSKVCKSLWPSF